MTNTTTNANERASEMTIRQVFAAAALTGLVANGEKKDAADYAVIAADALIDALNGAK